MREAGRGLRRDVCQLIPPALPRRRLGKGGSKISKNRRVSASQIPHYHVLVGTQSNLWFFLRRGRNQRNATTDGTDFTDAARRKSSVRSGLFVETTTQKTSSPVGAAYSFPAVQRVCQACEMPLLTELGNIFCPGSTKMSPPDGAGRMRRHGFPIRETREYVRNRPLSRSTFQ